MHKAVRIGLRLKGDNKSVYVETLTIGQDFDILLIRTLDKVLRKNKIDRLSVKSVEISGKLSPYALSSMVVKAVASALKV